MFKGSLEKTAAEQTAAKELALRGLCKANKAKGIPLSSECSKLNREDEVKKDTARRRYCEQGANRITPECRLYDDERAQRTSCESKGLMTPACLALRSDTSDNPCWSKADKDSDCGKCQQSIDEDLQCMGQCKTEKSDKSRRRCNHWARYAGQVSWRHPYCTQHDRIAGVGNANLTEKFQVGLQELSRKAPKTENIDKLARFDPDWMYHAQFIRQLLDLLDFTDLKEQSATRQIFQAAGVWSATAPSQDILCPGHSPFLDKSARGTFGMENLAEFTAICRVMISGARPTWMKTRGLSARDFGLFAARFGSFAECFQRARSVPYDRFVPFLAEYADQNPDLPYSVSQSEYTVNFSHVQSASGRLPLGVDNTNYLVHYDRRRHGLFLTTCSLTARILFVGKAEFRASLHSTYGGISSARTDLRYVKAKEIQDGATQEEYIVWWWGQRPGGPGATFKTFQQLANHLRALMLCVLARGDWNWRSLAQDNYNKIGLESEVPSGDDTSDNEEYDEYSV